MNRLTQPSTWAGFGILFQMLGALLPQYAVICHGLTAAAGAAAVAINEAKPVA